MISLPSFQEMKFARLISSPHEISSFGSRNGFRSNVYSIKENPICRSISYRSSEDSTTEQLYRRISPVGDPKVSIVPILDQWVEEGRSVDEQDLKNIIGQLLYYKRHNHALQISMWMTDKRYFQLSPLDASIRLQLISKAQGIEQAEKYFNSLSRKLKGVQVYSALLNCYATAQCVEKAEALMQKIRDLGYAKRPVEYNLMLNLYKKTGNMEKLDALLQEMEENSIVRDRFTLSIQLTAYAAVMEIEKMDKIVTMMESDPKVAFDWTNYSAAAVGYRKAGLLDKALEMLKKAEACVPTKGYMYAVYNCLLIEYATIGRKDEVVRIWSLYKKYKIYNRGYKSILKSLAILGDIEMAEEIFGEWESQGLTYDMHIPNAMIRAYSNKGMFEKAEAVIDRAISKGGKPDCWTWYFLATGYLEKDQPEKAVEMMKRAIVICQPLWKPSTEPLAACLEHLKGVGDMEEAQELIKLLLDKSIISLDIQEKLLNAIQTEKY
ncbi:pentatricopeptide repeat-containing protein At2g20710, mitochondrial-like [Euphorbia lathyris]|uniref:pentatricopeptide repeat-containing protein At2g20710, mitochondrial-like n=1 Tax=Euphorbia lathyris TaxID=212925 RepID=UPI003313473A